MINTLKELEEFIFPLDFQYDRYHTEIGTGYLSYSLHEENGDNFIYVRVDNDDRYENIDKDKTKVINIEAGNLLRSKRDYDSGFIIFSNEKNIERDYTVYTMDDFKNCLEYLLDIKKYTEHLFKHHLENLDFCEKNIFPILKKYKYKLQSYNLLDLDEKVYPSLSLSYKAKGFWKVFIDTDCITGDLIIESCNDNVYNITKGEFDKEKFENDLKTAYERYKD